ncbi:hypothetical protein NT6N_28090 [Oceaniferula spumae]|uniref:Beta-ketoacyl synthase-like N-terminal domain-containing protein n=1 Tax=Oceaniferula spumae TaxID=2979115 RepID=A0AAT9FPA7_9BACT
MPIIDTPVQSPLFIHGYGSVSAAGLDAASLYQACTDQVTIPFTQLERKVEDQTVSYDIRPVDQLALRGAMPKHPRLRRASGVSKFAITAAVEALGEDRIKKIQNHEFRLGIVVSFINGCVNYSNRFYTEALNDPALASPIIFPETVFNAPASHVAAYLGCDGPAYTLLGDSSAWFSAIDVARGWLDTDQVDGCLILCAEEIDWLSCEGLSYYSRDLKATEGAAALYVENKPSDIQLESLLGPFDYTSRDEKREAIKSAWAIEKDADTDLLVDGMTGISKLDRDENEATSGWSGRRISPLATLGSGMGANCGFQTVVALEALKNGHDAAVVFATGGNQHAYAARFKNS